MAVTLRASKQGLKIVDLERKKKGWKATAPAWYGAAKTSEATLKRFRLEIPIQQDVFIAICKAVGIENWEEIVDNTPTQQTASYMDFSVYNDEWVGRETLIQQLSARLNSSCRVLLLVGITGIGKTALAERTVEELRGDWREHRDNFEDNNKASDFASVVLQWLEKWGVNVPKEERKPEQLLRRLVKRLSDNL